MIYSAVRGEAIDLPSLVNRVAGAQHGAISVFIGTVRDMQDERGVNGIEYTAYEAMAELELQKICAEASERFAVDSIAAVHRIGWLVVGDASIAICAAHKHRSAAQECTRYIIEEVKKRLPIWKCEHYVDGTRDWVVGSTPQVPVTA